MHEHIDRLIKKDIRLHNITKIVQIFAETSLILKQTTLQLQ